MSYVIMEAVSPQPEVWTGRLEARRAGGADEVHRQPAGEFPPALGGWASYSTQAFDWLAVPDYSGQSACSSSPT